MMVWQPGRYKAAVVKTAPLFMQGDRSAPAAAFNFSADHRDRFYLLPTHTHRERDRERDRERERESASERESNQGVMEGYNDKPH